MFKTVFEIAVRVRKVLDNAGIVHHKTPSEALGALGWSRGDD